MAVFESTSLSWSVTFAFLPVLLGAGDEYSGGPMLPTELAMWAGLVSLCGGVAAAFRSPAKHLTLRDSLADILKISANTAVLGVSVALVGAYWAKGDSDLSWLLIGSCGILSLGGLATVDWAIDKAKATFGKKIDEKSH